MNCVLGMILFMTVLISICFMKSSSAQFLSGPNAPLVAIAGEELVLPCSIKLSTSSPFDLTVEWLRPDEDNSLVHLYKDHEDKNEKQAKSYRRRTSLFKEELQKGNASLKLTDVKVSDEGQYKCLIHDKSESSESQIHVIVEAVGSDPVITVDSYESSGGIKLVCNSRGWKPQPVLLWLDREGVTLPTEDKQIIHQETEGFMLESHITVHDSSDVNRFYCRILQGHHMKETEVIIKNDVFRAWRSIVGLSVAMTCIILGIVAALFYMRVCQKKKQVEAEHLKKKEFKKKRTFHSVNVTLDPETALPTLHLSADGKEVRLGPKQENIEITEKRFGILCVLGQQSFSSGRSYYEVLVKDKTQWTLGVVSENINRKEWVPRIPQKGFWTVALKPGNQYEANNDPPVPLTVRKNMEKVGVFVDREEGLVSFYDVDAYSLIYSFTDQEFRLPLYPYFSPRPNEDGKNSAPLIITPIDA